MNKSFSVAVVIPVYNRERYLAQTIQSVLDQTYPAEQVIVIDDGSLDGSLKIAQTFGNRVETVSVPNGGPSAARNHGLRLVTAERVIFLDSDDLLAADALETFAQIAANTNPDLIISDYARFNDSNGLGAAIATKIFRDRELASVLCNGSFATHSLCIRAKLVRDMGGFDESLPSHEDLDLWWRIAFLSPRIELTENVLAYYRDTPNSLTKNLDRMFQTRLQVICGVAQRIVNEPRLMAKCGKFLVNDVATLRSDLTLQRAETWEPGGRDDIGFEVLRMLRQHGFFPRRPMPYSIATFLAGSRGDELFRCWHDLLRVSGMIGPLRALKQLLGRLTRGAR